ncbi:unnamed protein product [Caenorhabditis bovis]|uniref:Transcription elongation factor n=1 Tax=Caenorhabditis bovis TaxID=2654633 RepID=A0A8S1EZU7_9PELO|nr:unnamed protein product [Caenorhabditis bovis]
MSTIEQVEGIAKKVDYIIANGMDDASACLKMLETLSKLPITLDIITKTSIGVKVNSLRKKVNDETVAKRAKNLIKDWKTLLNEPTVAKKDDEAPPPAKKARKEEKPEEPKKPVMPAKIESKNSTDSNASNSSKPSVLANFASATFPPKHLEGDELRLKTAQLLLSALRSGEMPQGTLDPEELAVQIEDKLYSVHRGTNQKYSVAVRSRVYNLRDKKNLALRENVLTGVVKPEKFAVMTAEEMASPEIREMRDKFTKEAILEHQVSVQQGTPSDMFKCGKCGKKNCTYTQLQTRSSDEPMTTFVFCLECGNRWKFC